MPGNTDPTGPRAVVVAELFTSEGCSSCPSADALLRRLLETQPVDGVEIVALGEHVDYWDHLGWRDPFSSPAFSARQSAYDTSLFRSGGIYTPQLVVDGAFQGVASDEAGVRRMLQIAARQPRGSMNVSLAPTASGLSVTLQIELPPTLSRKGAADIVIAVTEDGLTTQVKRGENGGRTLSHSAVVRTLTTAGQVGAKERTMRVTSAVPLKSTWARKHLRVVAFAQEQRSRHIIAAASAPVRPVSD